MKQIDQNYQIVHHFPAHMELPTTVLCSRGWYTLNVTLRAVAVGLLGMKGMK